MDKREIAVASMIAAGFAAVPATFAEPCRDQCGTDNANCAASCDNGFSFNQRECERAKEACQAQVDVGSQDCKRACDEIQCAEGDTECAYDKSQCSAGCEPMGGRCEEDCSGNNPCDAGCNLDCDAICDGQC